MRQFTLAYNTDYGIDKRNGWSVAINGSYHVEFWRGKHKVVERADIDWFDAYKGETGRAYGLECLT